MSENIVYIYEILWKRCLGQSNIFTTISININDKLTDCPLHIPLRLLSLIHVLVMYIIIMSY